VAVKQLSDRSNRDDNFEAVCLGGLWLPKSVSDIQAVNEGL
jgi:hypothetical protein